MNEYIPVMSLVIAALAVVFAPLLQMRTSLGSR